MDGEPRFFFPEKKFHPSPREAVVKQGPKIFLKCNGLGGVPWLALEVLFVSFFSFVSLFFFALFAGWLVWFGLLFRCVFVSCFYLASLVWRGLSKFHTT